MPTPLPFNAEQQQVIQRLQGSLLVLAPVGTGKTSVLSARVVHALTKGVDPNRVLCLTFTNRASKEMGDRLQTERQVTIKTFHGLCVRILRMGAEALGLPSDFVIYDADDSADILRGFMRQKEKDRLEDRVKEVKTAISQAKAKAHPDQLTLDLSLKGLFVPVDDQDRPWAERYQAELQRRQALDFDDLIFFTRSLLRLVPAVADYWANRYHFIQVDEVQDTHLGEYEVVRHLAQRSKNLAMIGDLDQTIYAWRGSEPEVVLNHFRAEFAPTEYSLSENYRATRSLLQTADAFANAFADRYTRITIPAASAPGNPVVVHTAADEDQEAAWIAQRIKALAQHQSNFAYNRVAVLTRTNRRTDTIAQGLQRQNVPCLTVERYQFFMRQEIKDALAYLRFLVNPFDTGAFKRLLGTPNRNIGLETLRQIYGEGRPCGLWLTDMALPQPFVNDDPLGAVMDAYRHGTLVVFDVETTGVAIEDEVVEIAAQKLVNGQPAETFHAYISDAADVGDSEQVHGYSNEFLRQHGQPGRRVLEQFFQFAENVLIVGHNVGFDIGMVTTQAQRLGLPAPNWAWADTLNLARRFVEAENYRLGHLAQVLNLPTTPTHNAMDDVTTTVELLHALIPKLEATAADRTALYYRYGETFEPLAEAIAQWKTLSHTLRPADLLSHILETSGLLRHYHREPQRLQNLEQMVDMFANQDDPALPPDLSLRTLLEYTALSKNLDRVSAQDNQVLIITAHQSKGLEFDHVFIAGLVEGEFPDFRCRRPEELEQEKHLFYVALTRAKQSLYLSSFEEDNYGRSKDPSQFIAALSDGRGKVSLPF
ncbi:MAG: 3'-5' exonuclease [Spirulina sp.]